MVILIDRGDQVFPKPMINGDNFDDGSSTENKYYENAIDDGPACDLVQDDQVHNHVHDKVGASGQYVHNLKLTPKPTKPPGTCELERLKAVNMLVDEYASKSNYQGSLLADSGTAQLQHETTMCRSSHSQVESLKQNNRNAKIYLLP